MTRSVKIVSLGAIAQIVAVICSNPIGLHDKVYISYLILIDSDGHAIWMDDPDQEDCERMYKHCPSALKSYSEKPCIWCKSKQTLPE